jgi:hypothetical protein
VNINTARLFACKYCKHTLRGDSRRRTARAQQQSLSALLHYCILTRKLLLKQQSERALLLVFRALHLPAADTQCERHSSHRGIKNRLHLRARNIAPILIPTAKKRYTTYFDSSLFCDPTSASDNFSKSPLRYSCWEKRLSKT